MERTTTDKRTITVKGVGKASVKPDLTVVTVTLDALKADSAASMELAENQSTALKAALGKCGIAISEIKTTDFNVSVVNKSERDQYGNYTPVFVGIRCRHALRVAFDFDMARLGSVLSALATCDAEPEYEVRFTVKDKTAVSAALLENAAGDAKARAEILARASGVKLGKLLNIDYNFRELDANSPTRFAACELSAMDGAARSMNITPDDVNVSDTVAFTWEIF